MEKGKKNLAILVAIATIVLIVIIGVLIVNRKEARIDQLSSQTQNLGEVIAKRDSILNDLFTTFSEIESSLTYIKQKRGQLEIQQQEGVTNQKESILSDIKLLDLMLENNNQKIVELDKKLRKSGIQLESLNKRILELTQNIEVQNSEITKLKQTIEDRNLQIAELNTKVDGLVSEVGLKDKTLSEKSEIITRQDKELNKGFLTFGTFKELKENGVLTKEGGFLGIGRNKSLRGNLKDDSFIKLDIRETREIPLFSKKASFITEHPDSSYHFVSDKGLITYLEIEKPEEFWKYSKYAVIETR
jgi:hypothetical protein